MKTVRWLALTAVLLVGAAKVSAQSTGGGTSSEGAPQESLEEKVSRLEMTQHELEAKEAERAFNEQQREVWSRRRSFTVGYSHPNLSTDGVTFPRQWGVFFCFGNTYMLHKKPFFGMMRIGLDVTWMDFNYYNHQGGKGITVTVPPDTWDPDYDYDQDYDIDLGTHKFEIGMGVGPSVNLAPFSTRADGLKFLRFAVYFHLTPSLSMVAMSDDGENALYGACAIFMNYGLKINYRSIGFGVEGRTGSATYDAWSNDDDLFASKVKFKSSSARVYLSLNF